MANTITLTDLAPVIYEARDIVARELTGGITSVSINSSEVERAAFGDTVQSFITGEPTLNESYTPAMTIPSGDDQTVGSDEFALDKVANVKIPITGETSRKLDNSFGREVVLRDMFAQAIRKITNTIEMNVCLTLKKGASRATGTAGTTPFASDFKILPQVGKILKDNGAPEDGQLSVVLDTAAGANLRGLAMLNKVNESGDSSLLRRGELLNLQGFSLKESAGIAIHTKGTAASATVSNAGYAIGSTTLTLSSAGTGTIVPGDVLNFASENNGINYVVTSGDSDVSDGGTIAIGKPGLRAAMSTATKAITVGGNYTANIALHKLAAELAMRAPAQPAGGDAAVDRMFIGDPVSGLVFEVAEYKGYGMAMFDITVFYGCKVWKQDFVAILMG